jgi:hypothetical protein
VNINPRIKKDIIRFYTARELQGKIFSAEQTRVIFKTKHIYSGSLTKFIKYKPGDHAKFTIRNPYLVERPYVLDFLNEYCPTDLWRANYRHLTGTTLYCYYDTDNVSFWKLPKYGRTSEYLPDDIEEHHIGKRIVNRQQVLIFLRLAKTQKRGIPIQLNLFN